MYKNRIRRRKRFFLIVLLLFICSASAFGQNELEVAVRPDPLFQRIPDQWNAFGEEVKITREDIHEKRKIITTIRVVKDGVTAEYHRVSHDWGAVYYFRNGSTSIPENLFVQWTGMRY